MSIETPENNPEEIKSEEGTNIEKEKEPKMFEAVIILSSMPDFDRDKNHVKLSFDGKMRAIATGEMYKEGLFEKLIISGGKTFGEELPSEAQIIADYLIKHFEISEEAIIREEASINTMENIKNIEKVLEDRKINGKLAVITSAYHIERLQKILENEGLEANAITAEEMLLKRSGHYKPLLEKYLSSGSMKVKEVKEAILRSLLIIDPKGKIPGIITRKTRK